MSLKSIAVFCGSNKGRRNCYSSQAESLAEELHHRQIRLIYGGAKVGVMGVLADKMLALGGEVTGVIPQSLVDVEVAHQGLTTLHTVNSMHQRKALIAELADAFILFPGGPGSLDEFFEMMTWAQLGYHDKPCAILNISGYYDKLLQFIDHAVSEGFLKTVHRDMLIITESINMLLDNIDVYQPPQDKKWIEKMVADHSNQFSS